MSYLIEKGGERQYVGSLDGYEDWTLVHQGTTSKPKDNHDWDPEAKRWKLNPEKKAKRERRAKFLSMDNEKLVDWIEEELAKRDARIKALEDGA